MEKIGVINKILNSEYLLAILDQDIHPGTELVVYQEFKLDKKDADELKLGEILYPKGKVVVISKQKDNIYLLSTKVKRVTKEVAIGTTSLIQNFYKYYDVENVESYATLNTEGSLGLDFNKNVDEGDILALN